MSQRSNHLPKLLANVCMVPFKESGQFLFLCKPCVVYSMFPHITQKILTTDTFHWLALIPNSQLSYRYSVWEKQPLGFLKTSENLQENNKKIVFLSFFIFHFFLFHLYLTVIATRHFQQYRLVRFHCKSHSISLQFLTQKALTKLQALEAATRSVL